MIIFLTALKRIFSKPINVIFIIIFPLITFVLISIMSDSEVEYIDDVFIDIRFGIVDQDNTVLSQTLISSLEKRYVLQEFDEEDITLALTDATVPWILVIREGYAYDVLAGREPQLDGYSLTISDVSALVSVAAQNITHALILLGTDDYGVLSAWRESSYVDFKMLPGDDWEGILFWLGFYGFIIIFTANFVIRTLSDDRRRGMPDRLGVLPQRQRSILVQGALAAFAATTITTLLLLAVLRLLFGEIPNVGYLFLLLSMYNLFSVGLSIAVISGLNNINSASIALIMFATLSSMLGGVYWPIEITPVVMQRVAWFSPGFWFVEGLKDIQDITFSGYGVSMLFLAGFSIVALLLCGWKKIQPIDD